MAENTAVAKKDKKKTKSFFKGLKAEFRKIIWTDRKTLTKQTIAVIVISAILCVIITLIDSGALALINLMVQ